MANLTKFWSALESLPVLAAVAAEWRALVGEEFDVLSRYFRTGRERALTYPNPSGGEPYYIVEHIDGDLVGVSEETGETINLTPSQLAVYHFDLAKFVAI